MKRFAAVLMVLLLAAAAVPGVRAKAVSRDVYYGANALGLTYYTPESLGPMLNWTTKEIGYLLFMTQYTDPATNATVVINSADQYWDLQRLGLAMGLMDSVRIFLIETWEFYPVNKQRVTDIISDPSVGIASRWSIMSAKTPDKHLRVGQFASIGSLFADPFNPVGGITDYYSKKVWNLIHDTGGTINFDGIYVPYRCKWALERGNFVVPNNAVIYNQTRGWIAAHAGETANVKVTVTCDMGEWQNGVKMTVDDIKNYIAFYYAWAYKDTPDDPYYDSALSDTAAKYRTYLGFQFTDNGYVVYGNYVHPFADDVTAGNYVIYPCMPWELYWAMGELVANGGAYGISRRYSFSSSGENLVQLDLLTKEHVDDLAKVLQAISSSGAMSTFPGIDWSAATSRINADLDFYSTYGHFVISNGPYILDMYSPENLYLKLIKFNGQRSTFNDDPMLPEDGYADVIEYQGVQNEDTLLLLVAEGEFDIGLFAFGANKYLDLSPDLLSNLSLYNVASSSVDLTLNPYHDQDKDAPIVTLDTGTYFNPFAVREIRFALNYLVNRRYIVDNIFHGGAAPALSGIAPSDPASKYFTPVYRALGLTEEGDFNYAMRLIDEGMKNAMEQVARYGHTLEKRDDGFWYFDGQPVEVKFVIRTEDERKDIGLYVSDLIENYMGFKVDRMLLNRQKASEIVFRKPISTYEWTLYTGGWGAGGLGSMYPDWQIYYWYSPLGYYPNFQDPRHQPDVTVEEVLEAIGKQYASVDAYAKAVQNASRVYFVFNNLGTPDAFSTSQYVSRTVPISTRTVSKLAGEFSMTDATSSDVIVSVGGPLVNPITAEYDDAALVHMAIGDGGITIVTPQGNVTWRVPKPWWNVTEGYFIIQFFNDRTTGALLVTIYGTDADSTAAGAYYFLTHIYQNIDAYGSLNYIVGLWSDTEFGSDIPLPGSSQGDTSGFSAGDDIIIVAMG
ncbi:ABC transporter substrate-binding protein [Thermococcus sp. MAR1]|uniref:ABC transporter substrate-binding protein n=1 Tax=Thermococcus sp. MAR1 TaxID=1638263 RepID=UPI001F110A56|nr:ABC transporter substrate-binding protein [Thermococcus sp. MAR1]